MESYQLLSYQMRDIKNALTGVLNRVLLRYDVSPVMMFTLELLLKHPEYIAMDIASEVGVTRGAITQLLDKMEKQGLVSRHPHPTSRRSLQIRVTDQGHVLANSVLNEYHEQIAKMFDVYSNDEIVTLSKLLSKLPL
ncbi:MarR family winged helix-turn-helix transcriptional regulator [Paenibacillus zanthoxyli]|uniref:MarR family winged helix-turn-helix transcriptional regulator n=1 Tax=Paenibacillus zanthoxyli TaxID=369399 RepID=UPI0004717399|nr:MarR family transcriptional regulator [Paenibacillus zanthoxyli]